MADRVPLSAEDAAGRRNKVGTVLISRVAPASADDAEHPDG